MSEIPKADWTWFEVAFIRFEQQLKKSTRPQIEDFLQGPGRPRETGTRGETGTRLVCLSMTAGETEEGNRDAGEGNRHAIGLSLNLTAGWNPRK
jgi:hypothetical protein